MSCLNSKPGSQQAEKPRSRRAARLLFGLCAALAMTAPASALDYPSGPVKLIVGSAPGSVGDLLARMLAQGLAEEWKQQVIVDNRPGAGGIVPMQALVASPNDGYTLMLSAASYATITPLRQATPYDIDRDIVPIAMTVEMPLAIGVGQHVPVDNVAGLIAYARSGPQQLTYGGTTPGTFPHLAMSYFASAADIDLQYVPYKGVTGALQDVIGGRVDLVAEGIPALAGAAQSGAVKLIAVTSSERVSGLENVPAVSETIPNFSSTSFFFVAGPKGISEEIVSQVNQDVNRVLPKISEQIEKFGAQARSMDPEELRDFIRSEREIWKPIIKQLKLDSNG